MFLSLFILNILYFFIFIFSIGVITSENPIYSVCNLIGVFLFSSFYLIILNIYYIAFTYLIIYIGAIATLFLFVIIILNVKRIKLIDNIKIYNQYYPLALFFSSFFLIFLNYFLPFFNKINSFYNFYTIKIDNIFRDLSHIQSIGIGLYTYNIILLILIGLILLLCIISAILLTINNNNK